MNMGGNKDVAPFSRSTENPGATDMLSHDLLEAACRMARVGAWRFDPETQELYWSGETHRIHEVPPCYKPNLADGIRFYHPDDRAIIEKAMERALYQEEPFDLELRFITARGNELWVNAICAPQVSDGKTVMLTGTFQDITTRKKTEEELRSHRERLEDLVQERTAALEKLNAELQESEARYRGMFENMTSAVAVYEAVDNGEDFIFRDFNPTAEKIEQVRKGELLGKRVLDVFPGAREFGIFRVFQRVWATGSSEYLPASLYRDSRDPGTWRDNWVFKLPDGRVAAVYNDVSERMKADEELDRYRGRLEEIVAERTSDLELAIEQRNDSLRLLRDITDNIPSLIYIVDHDGRFHLLNKPLEKLFKVSPGALLKKTRETVLPPEIAEQHRNNDIMVFESQKEIEFEEATIEEDGPHFYHTSKFPLFDRSGSLYALGGISTDITERKKTEAELLKYREHLEELVRDRTAELEKINTELESEITERRKAEEFIKVSLREKEMLLKEIHHRVKNNMQVISSLLSLQSRQLKDPVMQEAFRESQNRIKSMLLVHQKLYQSANLSDINLGSYLNDLITLLSHSYGKKNISFSIEIVDMTVDIEKAVPLGLIAHELLSNALKHAFPGEAQGEVRISLTSGENSSFTIGIGDNGIDFPDDVDFRKSSSLGLQLVNDLVAQLKGTIEMTRDRGKEFAVHFRAD
ncbi:MAG: PAS domain-containing protein [Candidatus Xenobiia bacterium LiM19]